MTGVHQRASERACPGPGRRQGGFSLIAVFLLMTVMMAVAGAVLLGARTDVQITGHEREQAIALYAAEAGAAHARAFLAASGAFDPSTRWSGLLARCRAEETGGCSAACREGSDPAGCCTPSGCAILSGSVLKFCTEPDLVVRDGGVGACPHDKVVDASYVVWFYDNRDDANASGAAGTDVTDTDSLVVIHSVGRGPNSARAVLDVGVSHGASAPAREYGAQGGGGPQHSGASENEVRGAGETYSW